jgi:hypothetical protein
MATKEKSRQIAGANDATQESTKRSYKFESERQDPDTAAQPALGFGRGVFTAEDWAQIKKDLRFEKTYAEKERERKAEEYICQDCKLLKDDAYLGFNFFRLPVRDREHKDRIKEKLFNKTGGDLFTMVRGLLARYGTCNHGIEFLIVYYEGDNLRVPVSTVNSMIDEIKKEVEVL